MSYAAHKEGGSATPALTTLGRRYGTDPEVNSLAGKDRLAFRIAIDSRAMPVLAIDDDCSVDQAGAIGRPQAVALHDGDPETT